MHQAVARTSEANERSKSRNVRSAIVIGGATFAATALIGASILWIHYGTAIFFETIASGIAACF